MDLDGTLAEHDPDAKFDPEHIGPPIPAMLERVKAWLAQGDKVVIFTARAAEPANIPPIKAWLKEAGLPDLEVTSQKTPEMEEFWDDRAVAVEQNVGMPSVSMSVLKICGLQ